MINGIATGIKGIYSWSTEKAKSSIAFVIGVAISVPSAIINLIIKPYTLESDKFAHLTDTSIPMDQQRIVMAHNSDTFYGSTTIPLFSNQMQKANELILTTPVYGISLDVYILPNISDEPVINHGGIAIPTLSPATYFEDSLWRIKAAMIETNKFIVFFIENYIPMEQIDTILNRVFGDMIYTAQEQGEAIASLGRMPSMDEALRSGNRLLILGTGGSNFLETYKGVWNSTHYKHPDFNLRTVLSEDRTIASIFGNKVASPKLYTGEVDNTCPGILFLDQLNQRDPRFLLEEDRGGETVLRPDVSLAGDTIYLDNAWARSIFIGVGVFLPTYCIASSVASLKKELVSVIADRHSIDHILAGLSLSEQSQLLEKLEHSRSRSKKEFLKKASFSVHVKELGQLTIVLAANLMMLGKMSPLITRILSSLSVAIYPLSAIILPYLVKKFNKKRVFSEEEILEARRKLTESVNCQRYERQSITWLQRATLLGMLLKISTIAKITTKPIIVSAQTMAWVAQLAHATFSSLASYQDVNAMIRDIRFSITFIFSGDVKEKDFLAFIKDRHNSLLDLDSSKIKNLLLNAALVREFKLYLYFNKISSNKRAERNLGDAINEQLIKDASNKVKNKVWSDGIANTSKIFLSTISLGLIFPANGHIAFCLGISTLLVGVDVSRSISRIQANRLKFKMTQMLSGEEDKESFEKNNLLSVIAAFIRSNLILILFAIMVSFLDFLPSFPSPLLIFIPILAFTFLGGVYSRFSEHFSPIATNITEEEKVYFKEVSESVLRMKNPFSFEKRIDLEANECAEPVASCSPRRARLPNCGEPMIYRRATDEYEREVVDIKESASLGDGHVDLVAAKSTKPRFK